MNKQSRCSYLIRQLTDTKKAIIPIVALTANALKGNPDECLAAGMKDYRSKPVTDDGLLAVMERVFAQSVGKQKTFKAKNGGAVCSSQFTRSFGLH